ncbi:MAG: DNA repair protein RecO [Gemmatimonadetes bacterium]|nr:DNA repair protein RecO [Gemmatimonadota bacterium]
MHPVATQALVLHAFDYRESSRIVRLATAELGIVSVIARGTRSPKSKMGSALDLFTGGIAHLRVHPSRDLHSLAGFDATRSRPELAESLARFRAASALAELCLRFGKEDESGRVHDAAVRVFDAIGVADDDQVAALAIAGAWRLIGELGFAPAVEECASCHTLLDGDAAVTFDHRAGGALCATCGLQARGGRTIPGEARRTLAAWLAGDEAPLTDDTMARAHRRLLREFVEEHIGDDRPLRAFLAWEEASVVAARDSA